MALLSSFFVIDEYVLLHAIRYQLQPFHAYQHDCWARKTTSKHPGIRTQTNACIFRRTHPDLTSCR